MLNIFLLISIIYIIFIKVYKIIRLIIINNIKG